MVYNTLEEAQKAYSEYVPKARSQGLMNVPQNFPISTFKPGQTYYSLAFDQSEQQGLQNQIGQLTSDPTKRDINGEKIAQFYNGQISLEDLRGDIASSPTFNPNIGPQINTGAGARSLTPEEQAKLSQGTPLAEVIKPTIISSAPAREQAKQDAGTIQQFSTPTQPSAGGQSYTVKSGDTLNAIAKSMGVDPSQITGYRSGDPKLIYPGEVLSVGQGAGQGALTATSPNVALQNLINQANSYISEFQKAGGKLTPENQALLDQINANQQRQDQAIASGADAGRTGNQSGLSGAAEVVNYTEQKKQELVSSLLDGLKTIRSEISALTKKGTAEQGIETQLTDLQAQIDQKLESVQAGRDKFSGQPIPMGFIVGQDRELVKQGNLDLTVLQNQEKNLLTKLGLAQEARKLELTAKEGEYKGITDDIQLRLQIDEALRAEQRLALDKIKDASTQEKNAYALIADFGAKGADVDSDPSVKREIIRIANENGLDAEAALGIARAAYKTQLRDYLLKVTAQESKTTSKPSTGLEKTALGFYNRAEEANQTASDYESTYASQDVLSQTQGQYAPSFFQTPEQQMYRQAQRAFTEARLRKESGAAIPDAEFENDAKTYFAQPGDDAKTIAQKTASRQTVLDGLKFQSGNAYSEYYGEANTSSASKTVKIGGQDVAVGSVIVNDKGQQGIVNEDGTITPLK